MDNEWKERIEARKEVIKTSYESAKSYANVIMMGGYAGLFTIWAFTKDRLEPWQVFSVALFALISVSIFITFEIYAIHVRGKIVKESWLELEKAGKLGEYPAEYGKVSTEMAIKHFRIWPWFFLGAILFAFLAVVVLLYSFITGLIKLL